MSFTKRFDRGTEIGYTVEHHTGKLAAHSSMVPTTPPGLC